MYRRKNRVRVYVKRKYTQGLVVSKKVVRILILQCILRYIENVKILWGNFLLDSQKVLKTTNNVLPLSRSDDKSRKKFNFATSKIKKQNFNLTIDTLSLGIYAPGPQVLTYLPQILRGVRI